jgi:hypothetical protein
VPVTEASRTPTEGKGTVNRFKLLVAGLCVAAVVLSTSVAFAKPLSEKQWRKQANVICKQSNEDLSTISDEVLAGLGQNDQPTVEQMAAFVEQAAPSIEQTIASIDALKEPKALKKDVKKWLAAATEANTTWQEDPATALDDDLFGPANKIGKRLGVVCGN